MGTYVYDQTWREERRRLAGMEALWDPGTRATLESLGVGEGWRCLDVGAGGGSTTEWLASRVGESGSVLAVDISTRYLDAIERPNVEVRELNVLEQDLPEDEFDLVCSRLVVEHLGTEVIRRMARAAKPGGWVLVEDYDFLDGDAGHPPNERFAGVVDAIVAFMEAAGFDRKMGRKLVAELRDAGLEDVHAEGRVRVVQGGTPETAFFRLSLESLGPALVQSGALTQADVDESLAALDDPSSTLLSPIMVAAVGRKPA